MFSLQKIPWQESREKTNNGNLKLAKDWKTHRKYFSPSVVKRGEYKHSSHISLNVKMTQKADVLFWGEVVVLPSVHLLH